MSERQREANRRNGALGGPKTPEGKAISKLNATRHALTARDVVLNSEEEPLFTAMIAGYMDCLKPVGLEEIDLVREIVSGRWRQERWWRIESAIIDLATFDCEPEIQKQFQDLDPQGRVAYALVKQHGATKALELVSRYEGRMRRLHERARRDLERLQNARKTEPTTEAAPPEIQTRQYWKNEPKPDPKPPETGPSHHLEEPIAA